MPKAECFPDLSLSQANSWPQADSGLTTPRRQPLLSAVVDCIEYVFDSEGNPMFLAGLGSPEGDLVEIDFEVPIGMRFKDFNPDDVVKLSGGSA